MSKEMTLFGNKPVAISDKLKEKLSGINDNLIGGFGDNRRISIRGGKFRQIVGGEQIAVSKSGTLNFVIVDAAPVSRTYYEGTYDPDKNTRPTCWSADTKKPSDDVPDDQKQASRCIDCPMNVKGSGVGDSRACRYNQRLAVVLEGALDEVYQLQLPATSIFGDASGNAMPMQSYARHLHAHNTPAIAVVTQAQFDDDSDMPKLFFTPVRPLDEAELEQVLETREDPAVERILKFSPGALDAVGHDSDEATDAPPKKPAKKAEEDEDDEPKAKRGRPRKKSEVNDDDDAEPVEEPSKVVKKSTPAVEEDDDADLAAMVDDWDDEDDD